jgi:hypothetical protein
MRHQYRQVCVRHDVASGAAENRLPQPARCEGSLDQQITAFRHGRSEDRFTSAPAFQFNAQGLRKKAETLPKRHSICLTVFGLIYLIGMH